MAISNDLKHELTKDFHTFREACEKFYNKEMSVGDFKGISGNFGSYAERGAATGMLRLRLPGGAIRPFQYDFLHHIIKDYNVPLVHFTTGQTIQLHNLSGDTICSILEECAEYEIYPRGGGGDNPRNLAAAPLRGVDPSEYFDISPYVKAAAEYALSLVPVLSLPRKYKIGFTSTVHNEVHATFRDLGFVARPDNTFDVYCCGGLGPNPLMGVQVGDAVAPTKVLYYIKAMANFFMANGNYKVRSKSRSRYIQAELGIDGLKTSFAKYLDEELTEGGLDFVPEEMTITKKGISGEIPAEYAHRIFPQKQPGLYCVAFHPIGGSPDTSVLLALLAALSTMKDTEIRLAMDETAYIINLTAEEAKQVAAITEHSAGNAFESSVSCVGANVCQIGLQDSNGLLQTIVDTVKPYNFPDGALPKIHISGCPSSCGTHQIGSIGLHGSMKVVDKVPTRCFNVAVGGNDRLGSETFGELIGNVPVANIPELFVALGKTVIAADTNFESWHKNNSDEFKQLVSSFE